MRILIVDDEEGIVRSMSMFLKTKGFKDVITLVDSRLVIDYIYNDKPDVMLLDLNMPHLSGITILKKIRKNNLKLKVIIVTAIDDKNMIDECKDLGVDDFLIKPVNSHSLINSLEK